MKAKKPSSLYIEDPQIFRQTLLSILTKFGEHDTQKEAAKELRDLFAAQVTDPERFNTVLRLMAETNEHQKSGTKKELVRAVIILAEVFEERLVEFMPKVVVMITKWLKEDDPQVNTASTEATKALISMCLKGLSVEQFTEQLDMMLKSYLALFPKAGKNTQAGAAMCIAKIIQTSPIECVFYLSDEILMRLTEIIKGHSCKAHLQILEALLSLISATEENPEKLVQISGTIYPVVVNNFEHPDWNVRKISVEIIYAFNIFTPGLVISNKPAIIEALDKLRVDKSKQVRDIAITTLHAIDGKRRTNKSSPSKEGIEDSPQKSNLHDETFGGGEDNKKAQRTRSPGGRLKVNESFFENAPKDGEIQIKFKSPPKGYHYEDEERKDSRSSPSKHAVRNLNFGDDRTEIGAVFQKMSQINQNQSKIIDSIENFQSNNKQELGELKSRVNVLEDKIQNLYKQPSPTRTLGLLQQGYHTNLPLPVYNTNASIQVIPQAETIIYSNSPGVSNDNAQQFYSERAESLQYNSKAKDFQDTPMRYSPKTTCWQRINEFLSAGSLNDAYETCLVEGDETTLINLMEKTGVVINQLEQPVVESFLWRIRDLLQNPEYSPLLLLWVQGALELELPGPLFELLNGDLQIFLEEKRRELDPRGLNALENCFSTIKKKQAANLSLY